MEYEWRSEWGEEPEAQLAIGEILFKSVVDNVSIIHNDHPIINKKSAARNALANTWLLLDWLNCSGEVFNLKEAIKNNKDLQVDCNLRRSVCITFATVGIELKNLPKIPQRNIRRL